MRVMLQSLNIRKLHLSETQIRPEVLEDALACAVFEGLADIRLENLIT